MRRLSESNSLRQKEDLSTTAPIPASSVEKPELYPLNQRKLAERLGLKSHTYLSTKKLEPGFPEWSKERDRENIGWKFDPQSNLFYPQP